MILRATLTIVCIVFLMVPHQSATLANGTVAAAPPSTSAPAVTAASSTQTPAPTHFSTAKPTSASTAQTSSTTTTTTKAAPTTTAKKKPKRLCKFPFWHRNEWRHECMPYGSKGAHWCSLTRNFTRDEEWRDCARYDLMRYKCSVPFHHAGQTYNQCQPLLLEPLARRLFWCSLVPSISIVTWANLGTDWTFCESSNATGTDYLKAVGGFRSQADVEIHSSIHGNNNSKNNITAVAAAAAVAVAAHAQAGDSKSVGESAGGSTSAAATPSSLLGVALAIVGVILAAVAVAAAFAVHRRSQYKRIDPLLSSEQAADKSSYGGMQAYHD